MLCIKDSAQGDDPVRRVVVVIDEQRYGDGGNDDVSCHRGGSHQARRELLPRYNINTRSAVVVDENDHAYYSSAVAVDSAHFLALVV
jgi:hypothetical protein